MTTDPSLDVKKAGIWRRRLAFLLLSLGLIALLVGPVLNWLCFATPPNIAPSPIAQEPIVNSGGRRSLGKSWLETREKLLCMELQGDPYSLGFANAALSKSYIKEQENEFLRKIREHVPSELGLWLLGKYVLLRNRQLPDFVSLEHQQEIFGAASGTPDPNPQLGVPHYHRVLNYHAAHDISHAVLDASLIGCTSFVARGKATTHGQLLLARNFDFNAGECFDRNKIVMHFKPADGLGFLSVGWPGMIGVVSGINEAKIAAVIHAGHSQDKREIGTPVALVLREVMQRAKSIDEAFAIIQGATVFVSDSFLIADGKSGEAAVIEKTPLRCVMRKIEGETLVLANHYESDLLAKDPANLEYLEEGTSRWRQQRMAAMVAERHGRISPETAVEILRDRSLPLGGTSLGHEASINILSATHGVVMDVSAGILWVSQSPHQLGAFVPFGFDGFPKAPKGAQKVAADPLLAAGDYERYRQSLRRRSEGQRAGANGELPKAERKLAESIALNPKDYKAPLFLGRLLLDAGRKEEARESFEKCLALQPAYRSERELLQALIAQAKAP